jgi:DNA-binding SARP family transcriptional activator
MDYRILGPLEVCIDGRALELGGEKPRALLAILLLHANEAVSVDRLIEGVWEERLPPSAHKTLQGYISRLRKQLENSHAEAVPAEANGGPLVRSGNGYLLRVGDGELDVDRFKALSEQGRHALATGDPATAATRLRDALGLWRGPALADLSYEAFAQPAIARLEELRLAVLEDRIDADLALGRDRELVGELSALIEQHPLRERLRGELMLALYRSGRQAEALEIYQQYRRALSHELGLDPSPALRELESVGPQPRSQPGPVRCPGSRPKADSCIRTTCRPPEPTRVGARSHRRCGRRPRRSRGDRDQQWWWRVSIGGGSRFGRRAQPAGGVDRR